MPLPVATRRAFALLLALALWVSRSASAQITSPDQICAATADPCTVATTVQVATGAMLDFDGRALVITATGRLNSTGAMSIFARQLQMDPSSQINLRGSSTTSGGSLDLSIDQTITISGTIDLTGNSGGQLMVTATSINLESSGRIFASGINSEASGGAIDLSADEIRLAGGSIVRLNSGSTGGGGTATMAAATTLVIDGVLESLGGDGEGGIINVGSGGQVNVGSSATVRANGSLSGGGGEVSIAAGDEFMGGRVDADLTMQGTLAATGGSGSEDGGGDGGSVDITSSRSCTFLGRVMVQGGSEASGGSVSISCTEVSTGTVLMNADIDARGTGSLGAGGEVTIDADFGSIDIVNKINTSGAQGGGSIAIDGASGITLDERITATGSASSGGDVFLTALGSATAQVLVTSDGTINADAGGSGEGFQGGRVTIDACRTRIDSRGSSQSVTALGPSGSISVTGVNIVDIAGRLSAGPALGVIELVYRDLDPLFESTATFSPAPSFVLDSTIVGCGEPAATRTPTPTLRVNTPVRTPTRNTPVPTATRTHTTPAGPSSTPTTRPTPAGPTDTNCNGVIDADETLGVISAIFDPQRGVDCPNADANDDGAVSVADILALLLKIAGVQ